MRHFDQKVDQGRKDMKREKETFDREMRAGKKNFSEKRKTFDVKLKKRVKDLEMSKDAVKIQQQKHPSTVHNEEEKAEDGESCNDENGSGHQLHQVEEDNLEGGCLAWLYNFFQK